MATFEMEFGTVDVEVVVGIPGPPGSGEGGGGAPDDATYLVTTAHADLSAEVVVGATPGGELGGTWASPTVDATHSGSSHAQAAAVGQAAAEATAAAALSAHEADTTSVHGITDTSALATSASVTAAVAAEATLARNADNLASGTVADARIASTIARDSEVTSAISTHAGATDPHGDRAYTDAALALKAPLASPTFTGNPTAPTQSAADNSTKLATTAYADGAATTAAAAKVSDTAYAGSWDAVTTVAPSKNAVYDKLNALDAVDALKAPLASPTFTGTPAAPTASGGDNTTQLATTAFVNTQAINAQTGTSYTIAATDVGKLVTQSNGSGITTTVPQDSDVTFAVGAWVELYQLGAGQITVQAGSGATLRTTPTAKARAQYSRLFLQKIAANTWALSGDIAAS